MKKKGGALNSRNAIFPVYLTIFFFMEKKQKGRQKKKKDREKNRKKERKIERKIERKTKHK